MADRFLFLSDPHLASYWNSEWESKVNEYLDFMNDYYNQHSLDFCLSCGDWLIQNDSTESALYKSHVVDSGMRKRFRTVYNVVGNHDYNYQLWNIEKQTNTVNPEMLSPEHLREAWCSNFENTYYTFDTPNAKYVVFDTGLDWTSVTTLNDHLDAQIPWFANILKNNITEHICLVMHILFSDNELKNLGTVAQKIFSMAQAFNERTTVTIDDIKYDFSECTGKIVCAYGGHKHVDYVGMANGIPVILVIDTQSGDIPSFDIVYADYENKVVNTERIGTGKNRTITLV